MISVKTKEQLELMRRAGAITRDTLRPVSYTHLRAHET